MSRYEITCPDDMPREMDFDAAARRADLERDSLTNTAPAWSRADVFAYRTALQALGFTPAEIDRQIAKDCVGVVIERKSEAA